MRGTTGGWSARPGSHRDVGSLASRGHLPAQRSTAVPATSQRVLPSVCSRLVHRCAAAYLPRTRMRGGAFAKSHAARLSRAARSSVFRRCSGYPTHSGGGAVPGRCDADPTRRLRTSVRRKQPAQRGIRNQSTPRVLLPCLPTAPARESCSRGNAVRYTASAIARRASRHTARTQRETCLCDGIRAARAVSGIAWGGMTAVGRPLPTSAPFSTDQSCAV